MKSEKKFYEALESIFVGAPIEGEGGYVNLLKVKEKYYSSVISQLKDEIEKDEIITDDFKEKFYELLFNFFEKYFSECGSVYFVKTANWQRVYEKVYNDNKDVVLFWKTHMLYYIKSDILFQSIRVKVRDASDNSSYVFYFDVGDLRQKQNNEKKELMFTYKEAKIEKVDGFHDDTTGDKTFVLTVGYSERGRKTDIGSISASSGVKGDIVEKAIDMFKKQTTVDFFINKNAKSFLEEQLELSLHQYLLEDDNVFNQTALTQIKSLKKYAKKLISFIAQFEDELVKIWNKPKFVRRSNYVITIDKLSKEIINKIRVSEGLKEQISEWEKLGFVNEGFSFGEEELKAHKHLPIDTKYFKNLELEILGLFDNLDQELDGVLIHSENYQTLNTLRNKYKGKIQCIYIDPPFNTGVDFIFIDGYQEATWLNIIDERLRISETLLKNSGSFYMELDHIAEHYGKMLLDNVFGKENFLGKITWNTGDNISGFKSQAQYWIRQADYLHFYVKNVTGNDKYKFTKIFEPLERHKFMQALNTDSSWLDLLSKEKNKFYVEKWDGDVLVNKFVDIKAKAKGTIWNDILSFQYSEPRITESISFSSNQKPENLLRRIIQSSTDQKDIVADFFAGSGTTCAVSQKLNRKWIGVEMGEYFNEFYLDSVEFKKKQNEEDDDKDLLKNFDKKCIISVIEETDKKVKYLINKIGLLGRMKIVLNGDKTFKSINSIVLRKPHLSTDINWQGGGFFKYYELEQYEDTLDHIVYSKDIDGTYSEDLCNQYIFFADSKLSDVLEVSGDAVNINFDKLYDDIDFPETISNLYGKPIEKITADTVKLADITEPIKYNVAAMDKEEKIAFIKMLRPLIWWGKE